MLVMETHALGVCMAPRGPFDPPEVTVYLVPRLLADTDSFAPKFTAHEHAFTRMGGARS